jgi:invasion protein IalB
MQTRFVIGLVATIAAVAWSHAASAQATVASPAIDTSIFKEGAVEDRDFKFEDWYARCRQIVKIKKRVCNLLSSLTDELGQVGGSVIIASTDAGIPAMLIALPREITQEKPIAVQSNTISKVEGKAVKVEFANTVSPMVCDTSCKYLFPLDSRLVFILNAGDGLAITAPAPPEAPKKSSKDKPKSLPKPFTISGRGFAQALSESTKPW